MKKFKQRNLRDYGFKCPNPECVDCHITEIALRVYLESLKLVVYLFIALIGFCVLVGFQGS